MAPTIDCRALAGLFDYPWERPEITDPALAARLKPLDKFFRREPLEEVQILFTRTFDLAPTSAPYLGFHLHGESYRRGTLMASLRQLYQRYGVDEAGELPDHVAVVLRLLAAAPADDEAVNTLVSTELKPGLDKLLVATAKDERDNPYRALLVAAAQAMEERVADV